MHDSAADSGTAAERSRRPRKRGRRGPKGRRRRAAAIITAFTLPQSGVALASAPVAASATPTLQESEIPVTTERKIFTPERSNEAGIAVATAGDTAAYTNAYGGEVQVAESPDPSTDSWVEITLAPESYEASFGADVALAHDGATLYVSAPESERIYVYTRVSLGDWEEAAVLEAPIPVPPVEENGIGFGQRLVADGERLLVGVPSGVVAGAPWSGFAYVVDLPDDTTGDPTWTPLFAGEPLPWAERGEFLALSGDRAALGVTVGTDASETSHWGGVYLWDLSDPELVPRYRELPRPGADTCLNEESRFGFASGLAFDDTSLFVGAPMEITLPSGSSVNDPMVCDRPELELDGASRGSVYRFDNTLRQLGGKIVPPPQTTRFGAGLSVAGDRLISSGGDYDRPPSWSDEDTPGELQVYERLRLSQEAARTDMPYQRPRPAQIMRPSSADAAGRAFGSQKGTHGFASNGEWTIVGTPDGSDPRAGESGAAYLFEFTPLLDPPTPGPDPEPEPLTLATADASMIYGERTTLPAALSDPNVPGMVRGTLNGRPISPIATENGTAQLAVPDGLLDTGSYPFTLEFLRDGEVTPSAQDTGKLTVLPAPTTVTLIAVDDSGVGVTEVDARTPVRLEGTVTAPGGTSPGGTVEIWDAEDNERLLALALDADSGTFAPTAADPGFLIADLDVRFEARYLGDGNHLPATAHTTVAALPEKRPGKPTPPPPSSQQGAQPPQPPQLAATGAETRMAGWPLGLAAVLALCGTAAVVVGHRRGARDD